MVRLESFLQSWKTVRTDAAQAVEDFPQEDLDFTPAEGLMSYRQNARHILEAGNALVGLLLDGEEDFGAPSVREKFKAYDSGLAAAAPGTELAAAMRASGDRLRDALSAQPAEFFAQMINGIGGQRMTRLEMLQFVKEHELTHRAQMFTYLRLKGIVPPTTRRKLAKK
ncbi:MAG: DinB family protein [Acidobacteria bacterium]|nr:DinB family protein [Acidobacteriota bacterium]